MTGTERAGERGAALVMALVFAAAMAGLTVAFVQARQSDGTAMRAQLDAVRARAVLDASLQQAAVMLANSSNRRPLPEELSWTLDGAEVRVRLASEAGKIDLNKAQGPLLQALPLALGLSEEEGRDFSDTVQDWRDANDLKRVRGAESRDYARAERGTSGAANRPLASTVELRYLPPVDGATWALLAPLVTVYSGLETPAPRKASLPVRQALAIARGLAAKDDGDKEGNRRLGASSPTADTGGEFAAKPAPAGEIGSGLSRPAGSDDRRTGSAASDQDAGDAADDDSTGVHSIRLDVRLGDGYEAAAEAVVALRDEPGKEAFVVLDWRPALREQSDRP